MTMDEILRTATDRLAAAGVNSPRVDAELMAAHLLGIERAMLATRTADGVSADLEAEYQRMVARRVEREPVQHIVGQAPFRHLMLAVGPGVFIPRPETELLVDEALAFLGNADTPTGPIVVDLCSGSGAVALSVALELPSAIVVAVEREPDAVGWLRRNAAGTSVRVHAGDANDDALLAELRGTVDVVLANPPYVPRAAIVDPEVHADPAAAVFGGEDGLTLMPAVIARAAEWLRPGGFFATEHDRFHGRVVPELLRRDGRWRHIAGRNDLTGLPRFTVAERV
jgi:release factor glutamine methyltransferase